MLFRSFSQLHRCLEKEQRTTEIGEPPSLKTRIRDRVDWIPKTDFINSYNIIKNSLIPSKTKENAFQVLNRTLWTKNKAYKSGMSENPNCPFCEQTETMEHLLMDCDCYSNKIWTILSRIYTTIFNEIFPDKPCNVTISFRHIIFHQEIRPPRPFPNRLKTFRLTSQLLVHEIRREIYFRRLNMTTSLNDQELYIIYDERINAHLTSTIKKVVSYLSYLSYSKWKESIQILNRMCECIISD